MTFVFLCFQCQNVWFSAPNVRPSHDDGENHISCSFPASTSPASWPSCILIGISLESSVALNKEFQASWQKDHRQAQKQNDGVIEDSNSLQILHCEIDWPNADTLNQWKCQPHGNRHGLPSILSLKYPKCQNLHVLNYDSYFFCLILPPKGSGWTI